MADGGDFVGSAAYIVRPRGPLQWLDPGAFGTLGVGGGFALGAKVGSGEISTFVHIMLFVSIIFFEMLWCDQ